MEHVGKRKQTHSWNMILLKTFPCLSSDPRREQRQIPCMEHVGRNQYLSCNVLPLTTVPCIDADLLEGGQKFQAWNTWGGNKYISWNISMLTTVPCLDSDPREEGAQIPCMERVERRNNKKQYILGTESCSRLFRAYIRIHGKTNHSFCAWNAWREEKYILGS